jgi:thioredoxin 2
VVPARLPAVDMSDLSADQSGFIVACAACAQRNRLPYARLDRAIRCAKCKAPLALPSVPLEVPGASVFDALIGASALPVLVDFWAPWCGPCHMVAPEIKKVAASEAGRLVVAKVNTEALPDLAARFGIQSIPTMALFAQGREVGRTMGARPAEGILSFVSHSVR